MSQTTDRPGEGQRALRQDGPVQGRHPLRGLLTTQFFGAFNDNAWKMLVVLLGMRALGAQLAPGSDGYDEELQSQTSLAFLVLTVPLMLFSIPAGVLSDRVSKRTVILWMKALELCLMCLATSALFFAPTHQLVALSILAAMGLQSAIFGPAKYGILPELVPHEELSRSNGVLEMLTFLAIIGGTAASGELIRLTDHLVEGPDTPRPYWIAGVLLVVFSVIGLLSARGIPRVPPARAGAGFKDSISSAWSAIRGDRVLWLAVLGSCFYWGVASLMGAVILAFGRSALGLVNPGMLLAVFGLGVGAGSWLAGRLSRGKVEYGLIPLGAVLLSIFTLVLAVLPASRTSAFLLMVPLGIASGWIVVPLNALLQWRAPADRRGSVIAVANALIFFGMILGNLLGIVLAGWFDLPSWGTLLGCSLLIAAGTLWSLWLLPDACLRLVLVLMTHTFYKLRINNSDRVPEEGGALLVPNHVSFVDGLFLIASVDRPVRFLVDSSYFKHRIYGPFLRSLGAIEISSSGGPRMILKAMRDAGKFLDEGEVVCIFAEGQITRTGALQPFRRGLERIVKGRKAPVIPVHLDRVWGSIFSRAGGRFLFKVPRKIPYPVTVSFGERLPASTPIHSVRRAVHELDSEAWMLRRGYRPTLHRVFVGSARKRPFRFAFADPRTRGISFFKALTGSIAIARALRSDWEGQERVGLLLPPSVGGALANFAASFAGKTSVNLNYTVGPEGMESAARQAELKTVLTSRLFLEKAGLQLPEGLQPVYLEDVAARIGLFDKLIAFFLGALGPCRWIEKACGATRKPSIDDIATVIFSSGSTAEPKGVLLSHFNLDSNVEAVAQILRVDKNDRVLGILPLFHSFGYLALWASANQGMSTIFLPNPLDAAAVGEAVQQHRVTLLIATPTFLQLYLRRCTPGQFGSLRFVLAGAEKLSQRLADAFADHFGVRPLEGYGTTECSPAIALSTTDFRAPGFFQPGSRRGSVGQPVPGVAVRIVDPENPRDIENVLPPGESGMLIARGPNVMQGYLGKPNLTAEVLVDGWYLTGDIAYVDDDGYVRITDRLSRFSKIGGEMVPHGKVEEALQKAAGSDIQVFAVTAVPDEKKGERLAVLHTIDPDRVRGIVEKMAEEGLPNLFIPRVDSFIRVDALPVLGTGKLDLREVKRVAKEALLTENPA